MFRMSPQKRGQKIVDILFSSLYLEDEKRRKISRLMREGDVSLPADNHALSFAIDIKCPELITHCLNARDGLDKRGFCNYYPLELAIYRRQGDIARRLLKAGADVNVVHGGSDRSMLMIAAETGDVSLCKALVKKGANKSYCAHNGFSLLHSAVRSGSVDMMEYILSLEPPMNSVWQKQDPFTFAVSQQSMPMADMILKAGLQLDFTPRRGAHIGLLAIARNKSPEVLAYVKDLRARWQAENAAAKLPKEDWVLTGEHEVAKTTPAGALPYKVTEIFNMSTGVYTRINRNMRTKAESCAMLDFAQISNRRNIEAAEQALIRLGGRMPGDEPAPAVAKVVLRKRDA
jgi:hypothetical protein